MEEVQYLGSNGSLVKWLHETTDELRPLNIINGSVRLTALAEEEESCQNNRKVRKQIQFSGPSTSTHIKVKNSNSLKVANCPAPSGSQTFLKRPSGDGLQHCKELQKTLSPEHVPVIKNSQAPVQCAENGAVDQSTSKAPLSKKPAASRVVKLKRTPLCYELSAHCASSAQKGIEQQTPCIVVVAASDSQNQDEFGLCGRCEN